MDYLEIVLEYAISTSDITKALLIDFTIQWTLWIIAYMFQTEKFYDLAGSVTFIYLVNFFNNNRYYKGHFRQFMLSSLIYIWAFRLGFFLFMRVLKEGKDSRFDKIKPSPIKFFFAWTMQGLWVFMTILPSIYSIQKETQKAIGWRDYIGWSFWIIGFLTEVIADYQKTVFRNDHANKEKFIHSGLWSLSRHPNYFGEILLWFGLYISASSNFIRGEYWTVVCPIFNYLLITQLSGIPILERRALKKWGTLPQYKEYLAKTPLLIPFLK